MKHKQHKYPSEDIGSLSCQEINSKATVGIEDEQNVFKRLTLPSVKKIKLNLSYNDDDIDEHNLEESEKWMCALSVDAHPKGIMDMHSFALPSGILCVATSSYNCVKIWDNAHFNLLHELSIFTGKVKALTVSQDKAILAAACEDKVHLISLSTMKVWE
jgi:WD40 repeat protein